NAFAFKIGKFPYPNPSSFPILTATGTDIRTALSPRPKVQPFPFSPSSTQKPISCNQAELGFISCTLRRWLQKAAHLPHAQVRISVEEQRVRL
ncbi:hypothetical protein BK142_32935, partial [Paenibacillus glucanolyticus]